MAVMTPENLRQAGLEALRLMNEEGCEGHTHVKTRERCYHDAKFKFRRKQAA